ncbi:MAG: hypothetical protein HY077_15265 [Elusimicrobia bacterium]|nr:hypothetical protein [Elusimicrobiota bacterium]
MMKKVSVMLAVLALGSVLPRAGAAGEWEKQAAQSQTAFTKELNAALSRAAERGREDREGPSERKSVGAALVVSSLQSEVDRCSKRVDGTKPIGSGKDFWNLYWRCFTHHVPPYYIESVWGGDDLSLSVQAGRQASEAAAAGMNGIITAPSGNGPVTLSVSAWRNDNGNDHDRGRDRDRGRGRK